MCCTPQRRVRYLRSWCEQLRSSIILRYHKLRQYTWSLAKEFLFLIGYFKDYHTSLIGWSVLSLIRTPGGPLVRALAPYHLRSSLNIFWLRTGSLWASAIWNSQKYHKERTRIPTRSITLEERGSILNMLFEYSYIVRKKQRDSRARRPFAFLGR